MSPENPVFAQRIASAQHALHALGLAACVVPSSDPHLSEYLPQRWQGRQWLSGFTGSMGTLVVTHKQAALFTDSRYWTQAEAELAGSGIELVKIETGASTRHVDWLAERLGAGQSVGVDGDVLSLTAAQQLRQALGKGVGAGFHVQGSPRRLSSSHTRLPCRRTSGGPSASGRPTSALTGDEPSGSG